jgi:glycosyltransferase involved in cell wall biosynthesis
MNKKILIIAAHSGRGFVHVDKLLPSLVELGYDVTFYGWDREKVFPRYSLENGIKFKMIYRGWGFANKGLIIGIPFFMLKMTYELMFINKKDFPIIMAIDFDAALPQSISIVVNRIPFIYNIRDNFSMRTTIPNYFRNIIYKIDKIIFNKAIKIIVPDINRVNSNYINLINKKIFVINNGALDIPPPKNLIKDNRFTIYAMGYLLKTRGIVLLLELAKIMPNIRILLAGDIKEDELLSEIHKHSNVYFNGKLTPEKALELCYESDLIFTFYDPISEINRKAASNKWYDAMMSGKPILINEEVEKSSWIIENKIGYRCKYGDLSDLKNTVIDIMNNPEDSNSRGYNGRKLFETGYSWNASMIKINLVISDSLNYNCNN